MEQREILLNRQGFWQEKLATTIEIGRSKAKNDVLEKERKRKSDR